MWPSGEARVSKTLNDGSNPSMTADIQGILSKQSLNRAVFLHCPFFIYFLLCIDIYKQKQLVRPMRKVLPIIFRGQKNQWACLLTMDP